MPGEQRVTDEGVLHIVEHGRVPTGGLATQYEIRLANALAEERLCTANLESVGRATEAKLRDALAEVERLKPLEADYITVNQTLVMWVNKAEEALRMAASARERATAAESALAATKAKLEALPKVCDGLEQDAFEQWAISEGYDMSQHPLHWLFLHPKTSGARQGWKAAIEYCLAALTTKETTDATSI